MNLNTVQASHLTALATQLRDVAAARHNLGSQLKLGKLVDGHPQWFGMEYFANHEQPLALVEATFNRLISEGQTPDEAFVTCDEVYRRDIGSLLYTTEEEPRALDVPGPVELTPTQRMIGVWKTRSDLIRQLDSYDDFLEGMSALGLLAPEDTERVNSNPLNLD